MKYKFTLAFFAGLMLVCQIGFGQNAYRSKQTGANYSWTNINNWEVFNGSTWGPASAYPTSTDGVITISSGDSIVLTTATTFDEVVVNGIFVMFSSTQTLNNGAATFDMEVNGKLYIGLNCVLQQGGSGTPQIQISASGSLLFPVSNARLRVWTTSYGTTTVSNPTGTTTGIEAEFFNYGTFNIVSGGFAVNSASLTNYNTINISGTSPDCYIQSNSTGGVRNMTTGTINKPNNDLFFINRLYNEGAIIAKGKLDVTNATSTSTGSIQTGATAGSLEIAAGFFPAGVNNTLNIKILGAGGPGVGYDQFNIAGVAPNLSSTNVVVTGNPAAPMGTYPVLVSVLEFTAPSPSNVSLPSGYSYTSDIYNGYINKNFSLPVLWGEFNAFDETDNVRLIWSTVQEIDASHFEVEFSTDGSNFQSVSRISAAGNSNVEKRYSFLHTSPSKTATNFYRIKQVDINGKYTYSKTVPVKLKGTGRPVVSATPNPVRNSLQIIAAKENFKMILTDLNGKTLKTLSLAKGSQYLDVSDLSTGTYYILFSDGENSYSQKIIKMR